MLLGKANPFKIFNLQWQSKTMIWFGALWFMGSDTISSISRARYFLIVMDDYSRGVWLYLFMRNQIDDIEWVFCNLLRNQFDRSIKFIQSNNGLEFLSIELCDFLFLWIMGLFIRLQQNGWVKRKQCPILNVVLALLFKASLPNHFWENIHQLLCIWQITPYAYFR